MYLKFKAHDILPYLPKELLEFMHEVYELNLLRNQQILKQLGEITHLLNEHGIYPTVLKGAGHLADHLYSNLGERIMRDIDLLVPEEDFLPSVHLLERDGYSIPAPIVTNIKKSKHYPGLSKAGVPATVEIHRLPVNQPYIHWYNTKIIDTQKRRIEEQTSYFLLSDYHNVIHNFIHSQLSHRGDVDGIVSFRDIYDLYLLSHRIAIASTLPSIHYKRKAISYFVFAGKALGLPNWFYGHEPLMAKLFCLKHDLNQSSSGFYQTYRSYRFLYEKIILGYSRQLIQSFYLKEMRQSVISRISNPHWYKNHLDSYTGFFKLHK
jgi:hypothetical protein